MRRLTRQVKDLATAAGASLVGIAGRERLADAPPSGDPTYLLPSARSVVSYAVALDPETARNFIAKQDWLGHCGDRKQVVRRLYEIGYQLAALLQRHGFEALNVDVNNNYRPEEGAADVTEMTEFHPEFSHRYGAVAAGVGRLGWSGNLMTARYGALVELGSVLTSAPLQADPLLEESPCDRCKMCALVCPVGMIRPKQSTTVTVAGLAEEISCKRPNTCCWIGCTGYEGLAASGTWSNWSPYRLGVPLPDDKEDLDALCIRLQKADPQMGQEGNSFADYRKAMFDPDWFYYTVCGFCRSVCRPDREERLANRARIVESGTAGLRLDGMHVVTTGEAVELDTPYGVKVVVPQAEMDRLRAGEIGTEKGAGRWPLDAEVIAHLLRTTG